MPKPAHHVTTPLERQVAAIELAISDLFGDRRIDSEDLEEAVIGIIDDLTTRKRALREDISRAAKEKAE